jgi:hypothetical protein
VGWHNFAGDGAQDGGHNLADETVLRVRMKVGESVARGSNRFGALFIGRGGGEPMGRAASMAGGEWFFNALVTRKIKRG